MSDYEKKLELERAGTFFQFAERNGFVLFPARPNGKKPNVAEGEAVVSIYSRDRADWQRWYDQGCNFGLPCQPNGLIGVDVDTKHPLGQATWNQWQALHGYYEPSWTTPSLGIHVLFHAPKDIQLTQCRLGEGVDTRYPGYLVCPPSRVDGRRYFALPKLIIHEPPAALIEAMRRIETSPTVAAARGGWKAADVASMMAFLKDFDLFEDYDEWYKCGMALRAEFGDAAFEIWFEHSCDEDQTRDGSWKKWLSFPSEPKSGGVTLKSFMKKAKDLGWDGSVGKSVDAMFAGAVEKLAQNAGATLPVGTPLPANAAAGMPMLGNQKALSDLAAPILVDFLANSKDRGTPRTENYLTLSDAMRDHGLYQLLNESITRVIAMAENGPRLFKDDRHVVVQPLAILQLANEQVFAALVRRIEAFGCELPGRKIKLAATALAENVQRATMPADDWKRDYKGEIEKDNPDNIAVLLAVVGCEVRWNGWLEQAEIRGGSDPEMKWDDWTYISDTEVIQLRTRAMRTHTRFKPDKGFFWDTLLQLAHLNRVDPILDRIAELEAAWDKTPRLDSWMTMVCGVSADPYFVAVARNIIGGMVKRARNPGFKHDTMAILYGKQGTGKSTLAAIIADMGATSLADIEFGLGQNFTDNILLGDVAKELVLSLRGKLVAEIGEMGMRGSANAAEVKAMISRQHDEGRPAYARMPAKRPRRNVFIGTTNDNEPLSDTSGNRRFLPVRCGHELNLKWLSENIAQIVGEAATLESAGCDFNIPQPLWEIAAAHAEAARAKSDAEIWFEEWFVVTEYTRNAFITGADLSQACKLQGIRVSNNDRSAIMERLDFRIARPHIVGLGQKSVWYRGPEVKPQHIGKESVRYIVGQDTRTLRVRVSPSLVPSATPIEGEPAFPAPRGETK